MGDVNRALGGGSEIEFEGKVYTLSPWTYEVQAAYERYIEREAVNALKRMKPLLTDEDYQEQLNKIQQDITIGLYTFGSEKVARSLLAKPHLKYLYYLLLRGNHPDVQMDLVGRLIDKKWEEAMEKMAEANADPTTEGSASSGTNPPSE